MGKANLTLRESTAEAYHLAPVPVESIPAPRKLDYSRVAPQPSSRHADKRDFGSIWSLYLLPTTIALAAIAINILIAGGVASIGQLILWTLASAVVTLIAGRWFDLDFGILSSTPLRILALGCAMSAGTCLLLLIPGFGTILIYIPAMMIVCWLVLKFVFDSNLQTAALCAVFILASFWATTIALAIAFRVFE